MKLYTINATPVQSIEQMKVSGYGLNDDNSNVGRINKLHIEEYPREVAKILASQGIDGFTVYQVQGHWKGEAEVSFKIELALEDITTVRLMTIAGELRDMYNQDSVMVTYPDSTVDFI